MIYSVLMKELLLLAEAHRSVSDRPAGVKVPAAEDTQDMVERGQDTSRQFLERDPVYYNVQDDTYVLAARPVTMSYGCSVVAAEYASAGQFLHPAKSEVLFPEGQPAPTVSVWKYTEMRNYIDNGTRLARQRASEMQVTTAFVVLGSKISSPEAQEGVVAHRQRAALKSYMGIRGTADDDEDTAPPALRADGWSPPLLIAVGTRVGGTGQTTAAPPRCVPANNCGPYASAFFSAAQNLGRRSSPEGKGASRQQSSGMREDTGARYKGIDNSASEAALSDFGETTMSAA